MMLKLLFWPVDVMRLLAMAGITAQALAVCALLQLIPGLGSGGR